MKHNQSKLSLTTVVIGVTIFSIVLLALWTVYTYYFKPLPEASEHIQAETYYTDELQQISKALEEHNKYTFNSFDIDSGNADPFGGF